MTYVLLIILAYNSITMHSIPFDSYERCMEVAAELRHRLQRGFVEVSLTCIRTRD